MQRQLRDIEQHTVSSGSPGDNSLLGLTLRQGQEQEMTLQTALLYPQHDQRRTQHISVFSKPWERAIPGIDLPAREARLFSPLCINTLPKTEIPHEYRQNKPTKRHQPAAANLTAGLRDPTWSHIPASSTYSLFSAIRADFTSGGGKGQQEINSITTSPLEITHLFVHLNIQTVRHFVVLGKEQKKKKIEINSIKPESQGEFEFNSQKVFA